MSRTLENSLKIVLAVLFFICLADMPYSYFQLVRFIALVGFSLLAYNAHNKEEKFLTIIFVTLAVLFQSFIKVALGSQVWNVIDVIVGLSLIISIFIQTKRNPR